MLCHTPICLNCSTFISVLSSKNVGGQWWQPKFQLCIAHITTFTTTLTTIFITILIVHFTTNLKTNLFTVLTPTFFTKILYHLQKYHLSSDFVTFKFFSSFIFMQIFWIQQVWIRNIYSMNYEPAYLTGKL